MKKIVLIVFILVAALLMSSMLLFNRFVVNTVSDPVATETMPVTVETPTATPDNTEQRVETPLPTSTPYVYPESTFEPLEIQEEYVVEFGEEDDGLLGAVG